MSARRPWMFAAAVVLLALRGNAAEQAPPPATPPASTPPTATPAPSTPAPATPPATPAPAEGVAPAKPGDAPSADLPPNERGSADNNITFPVDI